MSGYLHGDDGDDRTGSNYNYLSFFAGGSYGRQLEGKKSAELHSQPQLMTEQTKNRWRWTTRAVCFAMFLINVLTVVTLYTWKSQQVDERDERVRGFKGNLHQTIHQEMGKLELTNCQPRYRKTEECSQISAQRFLMADPDRVQAVWTETPQYKRYNGTSPGAFLCGEIEIITDRTIPKLKIMKDGFYQVHSHMAVRPIPPGTTFRHSIVRTNHQEDRDLSKEEQTPVNCGGGGGEGSTSNNDPDDTCFSSFLLATEQLEKDDYIKIVVKVNGSVLSSTIDLLVQDGRSTYFGIIKLGLVK